MFSFFQSLVCGCFYMASMFPSHPIASSGRSFEFSVSGGTLAVGEAGLTSSFLPKSQVLYYLTLWQNEEEQNFQVCFHLPRLPSEADCPQPSLAQARDAQNLRAMDYALKNPNGLAWDAQVMGVGENRVSGGV